MPRIGLSGTPGRYDPQLAGRWRHVPQHHLDAQLQTFTSIMFDGFAANLAAAHVSRLARRISQQVPSSQLSASYPHRLWMRSPPSLTHVPPKLTHGYTTFAFIALDPPFPRMAGSLP